MTEAERLAWNATVASGDPERIAAAQASALDSVHRRIMDDDHNYRQAGWKP